MTLSLQAQLGLDIDDNEIFAEEMLDYIHERYSKFGKNTRIVELFDNFLFFVCNHCEPKVAFSLGQRALRDYKIDIDPTELNYFYLFHDTVGPFITEYSKSTRRWPHAD